MSTVGIVQSINTEVIDLWREEFSDRLEQVHTPLVYTDLETDGLLFIGCNPALPKLHHYQAPTLASILNAPPAVAALVEQERQARRSYPYFRPCHDIAKRLGMAWTHVDWFFQRGTSQRNLEDAVLESPSNWGKPMELGVFARKQIALSRRMMDACRPRLVLVVNAFASKIARSEFNLGSLDENGLLWGEVGGRRVPVFLSSMLTGQRALYRGSRERLEWHMLRAKELTQEAGGELTDSRASVSRQLQR